MVCRKLELEPGQRVLDVGCGWGSFAIHAAERHDVRVLGITLSEPQAAVAQRRVRERGLADRVEIRVADYRELQDDPFDAVASIGMVEHVGSSQIDVYAEQLARALRPGGRLLNHGIARMRMGDPEAGPFSERYVFPDGAPLHLSRIQLAVERAGLVTDHVEGLHGNYQVTLAHWASDSTRTWTKPSGWPVPSVCASGGSTCVPPGVGSRAASSRFTRSAPHAPALPRRRLGQRPHPRANARRRTRSGLSPRRRAVPRRGRARPPVPPRRRR